MIGVGVAGLGFVDRFGLVLRFVGRWWWSVGWGRCRLGVGRSSSCWRSILLFCLGCRSSISIIKVRLGIARYWILWGAVLLIFCGSCSGAVLVNECDIARRMGRQHLIKRGWFCIGLLLLCFLP